MTLGDTQTLFNWQPDALDATVGMQLAFVVRKKFPSLWFTLPEVVFPAENKRRMLDHDLPFHVDSDYRDNYGIMWSNTLPTEVRSKEGKIFSFDDGDVILVNHYTCSHRMPFKDVVRWFVRLSEVSELPEEEKQSKHELFKHVQNYRKLWNLDDLTLITNVV